MQEQEGFDNSDLVELVEFHYKPLSIHTELKRRPTVKAQEGWQLTRDANRGEWAASLATREPQNVVFSPNMNELQAPDNQLQFEADFEGSNLELVIRRRFLEYELYLRPDTNTSTHFQWFYFRVKALKQPKTPTFTIKNFIKSGMLYSSGLRPYYRRPKDLTFQQLPTEVRFFENVPEDSYCLKFSFDFIEGGEEVQFSSQPPYSYSHLIHSLTTMSLDYKILCKSAMGKRVPFLTFHEQKSPKAIVMVIARQHPGESVGSWMMEGLLRKLKESNNNGIQWLVVPMMCVDGVILGNNRTGLAGFDYNRFWNTEELSRKEKAFPEMVAFLNQIKRLRRLHPRKPKLFIDLHGHSSQPNIFAYGPPHDSNSQLFLISRVFSQLLARKNANFSVEQCSYMIKPDKKNTSRSLLFSQHFIPFVYTIEASFGIMRDNQAREEDFLQFGQDLAETSQQFLCNCVLGEKSSQTLALIEIIKERGQQGEAVEYDSDNEEQDESKPQSEGRKCLAITDRGEKSRLNTESPPPITRKNSQINTFQLFRVEKDSTNRYVKPKERKRTQTEVGLSKTPKVNFLPRLKQTTKRQPTQSAEEKEEGGEPLMNIREIQKRLQRLRNSRIGKKILIINSYGM